MAMATRLGPLEREAVKERHWEHGGTAPGKNKNTSKYSTQENRTNDMRHPKMVAENGQDHGPPSSTFSSLISSSRLWTFAHP
jgi:hypothetical protein